jgi:hypothetical protein
MNVVLEKEYLGDTNFERAFLNYFKDFNITLYKADAYGNNFEKLYLADPESSSSAVKGKSCGGTNLI